MKKLLNVSVIGVCLVAAGCQSSSAPDEAKLHRDLSHVPDMSRAGQHKGANVRQPDGGAPGGAPTAPPGP